MLPVIKATQDASSLPKLKISTKAGGCSHTHQEMGVYFVHLVEKKRKVSIKKFSLTGIEPVTDE
jgi:hypothetical protein